MAVRGKPFKPGTSGNPGGRPKCLKEFRELIQRDGSQRAYATLLANLEDADGGIRNRAAEIILAYAYGRPAQTVETDGADGETVQIVINRVVRGDHS